jgi:CBS domain-containing protein
MGSGRREGAGESRGCGIVFPFGDTDEAAMKLVPDLIHDQKITTFTPKTTVDEAARLMAERDIGAVLITEGSKLVGIFSERDLLKRVVAAGLDPKATSLADVMTRNPNTLPPHADVREAMRLTVAHGYRHVPVVDGQRVVGIVSVRDIYTNYVKNMESGVSALARELLHHR